MNLSLMRYKTYVWPHNPKYYQVTSSKRIAVSRVPFGKFIMKNMGTDFRIFSGEGEFVGKNAYKEYQKLEKVFLENTPGTLTHPVFKSTDAHFVALTLKQEPTEDYINYGFEFWENCSSYTEGLTKVSTSSTSTSTAKKTSTSSARKKYTVKAGDTMWGIANRNGMDLSTLIKLNSQIKNPNLINVGDTIYLS